MNKDFSSETFQERLKSLIRTEKSANAFAQKTGITESLLRKYLAGSLPGIDKAYAIANAANVSINWLISGEDSQIQTVTQAHSVQVPRYNIKASAGSGLAAIDEEIIDYMSLPKELLNRITPDGSKLGIIEASGDSMEPTINDRDLLLVNSNITRFNIDAGGVFILSYGEDVLVKRLQVMADETIQIISDNPIYEPEKVKKTDIGNQVRILAKVIWKFGPIRI